jgi:hypothetical protein
VIGWPVVTEHLMPTGDLELQLTDLAGPDPIRRSLDPGYRFSFQD